MKSAVLLFLLGLAFCGGCIFRSHPVAVAVNPNSSGQMVSKAAADALVPGVTTYTEVVSDLGEPWLRFKEQNVIGYIWESHLGSYQFFGNAPEMAHHRNQAFALQFNDHQVLERSKFFSATNSEALHQKILNWAWFEAP